MSRRRWPPPSLDNLQDPALVTAALARGVREAVLRHLRLGLPVYTWDEARGVVDAATGKVWRPPRRTRAKR